MRTTVVFVAALLVVGAGAPFAAAAPSTVTDASTATGSVDAQDEDAANESENDAAPGARLAGVVEVQAAEVEGEIEQRSFGLRIAAANSNASKASVVTEQAMTLSEQLAMLQERKAELEAARENGTITESRFRAEIAGLAARISALEQLTNATAEAARDLPADAVGVQAGVGEQIERIRTEARNLSGPEVAAIARSIAGPPNGTVGPPDDVGIGPPPGPPGDDNRTTGPPDRNVTVGPPDQNVTVGPPDENTTVGPPDQNVTVGGPGDGAPGDGGPGDDGPSETATSTPDDPVDGAPTGDETTTLAP